jgi:hypothetical protein
MRLHLLPFVLAAAGASWASPVEQRQAASSTSASATATATPYDFREGAITQYPIHSSCNVTLQRQLTRALTETVELAKHARDHILRFGQSSPFVQKYFGNGTTAVPLGWYTRVISADRGNMTFRCDDPDQNCKTQSGEFPSSPS